MTKLDEPLTDAEAEHLLGLKTQLLNSGTPRVVRVIRRNIRYRLFRIRDGRTEFDNGLRKLIESQLEGRDTLKDFTFTWDVSPRDPLKVINMFEWESEGGKFDTIMELCDDGIAREKRLCRPPAFTNQA